MKSKVITGILVILLVHTARAQSMDHLLLQQNLVFIRQGAGGQVGSGFIIALEKGESYILTAAHVVGDSATVGVELDNVQGVQPATVLQSNEFLDVALLRVRTPGSKWKPFKWVQNYRVGDTVFILSLRTGAVIPADSSGLILNTAGTNLTLKFDGVEPGDSGSPLWTANGLVGLIQTRHPVHALPIQVIKRLVIEDWEAPWQLLETSFERPVFQPEPPPDLSTDMVIKPVRVSVVGSCTGDAMRAADGDLSSSWVCNKADKSTMVLALDGVQTVNRLKLYFPNHYMSDLPKAELALSGLTKTFKLSRLLNRIVERDGAGVWYSFDLGAYYRTEFLSLTFKPEVLTDKNNVDKIYPIEFFEIRIIGPKTQQP